MPPKSKAPTSRRGGTPAKPRSSARVATKAKQDKPPTDSEIDNGKDADADEIDDRTDEIGPIPSRKKEAAGKGTKKGGKKRKYVQFFQPYSALIHIFCFFFCRLTSAQRGQIDSAAEPPQKLTKYIPQPYPLFCYESKSLSSLFN